MKKILIILLLSLTLLGAAPEGTLALDLTGKLDTVGESAEFEEADKNTLAETVGGLIRALLSILGVIFMAYVVYAGQLWMTARGNEEQITKAKAIIRGSIIGLLIVFAAYAITSFVISAIINAGVLSSGA